MDFERLFEEISKQMRSDFAKAQESLNHPGLKGEANEESVRKFLGQYLPKTLDISSGTLVDSDGGHSRQLDVVISDAAKTPIFFQSGQVRVIPVECAYAVVEIKAYLDSGELERAFQNMQSVKALSKIAFIKPRGAVAYTHTLYGKEWDYWPTHYFIFAYDSPRLKSVRTSLVQLQDSEEIHKRIDSICVLDKGVILNMSPEGMFSALPSPGSTIMASETTRPLLLFYTLISIMLNQACMGYFNLTPYLQKMRF